MAITLSAGARVVFGFDLSEQKPAAEILGIRCDKCAEQIPSLRGLSLQAERASQTHASLFKAGIECRGAAELLFGFLPLRFV
jgi:hypothetical protein